MIKINQKIIGYNYPTYFIADIAANHDGDITRAKKLIELAYKSGADAVKFQHFEAISIVSDIGFKEIQNNRSHQSKWEKSVFETYKEAELPIGWIEELSDYSKNLGVDFFTAPYSLELIDKVEKYIPAFKIGSGDITWIESIEKMAKFGKPVFVATGASMFSDVKRAVKAIEKHNSQIVLMQCNTNYTGSDDNINFLNLNVLKTYASEFPNVVLGLSDHTLSSLSVIAAVTLGARAIEKHFTDDQSRLGPDHMFSLNPESWSLMVREVRSLEKSLGNGIKVIEGNEIDSVIVQQRSLRYSGNFKKGHKLGHADFVALRPSPINSIKPYELNNILGRTLSTDVTFHKLVDNSDFD
jgi:N-acetylneuraminate synthase